MKKNIISGFTFIELIVFMGIFSILLFIIINLFISVLSIKLESESTSRNQQDGRYILAKLMYDINQAGSIIFPSLGSQDNSLEIMVDDNSYRYSVNTNNLQLVNQYGTNILNSYDTEIINLNFQCLGNEGGKNTIKISFSIRSKIKVNNVNEINSFQTTVGIR